MLLINSILKEMKDIPADRLEDLYSFVHSLSNKATKSESQRKKILRFGGSFSDMTKKNYRDFVKETRKIRSGLFDRTVDL